MSTPKGTVPWNKGKGEGWTDKRGYRWRYVQRPGTHPVWHPDASRSGHRLRIRVGHLNPGSSRFRDWWMEHAGTGGVQPGLCQRPWTVADRADDRADRTARCTSGTYPEPAPPAATVRHLSGHHCQPHVVGCDQGGNRRIRNAREAIPQLETVKRSSRLLSKATLARSPRPILN